MARVSFLLSKSLESQMSMDTCVEAGMATNFQSASQSTLAKVLRFANVDIEKETKNAANQQQQQQKTFYVHCEQNV